MPSLMQGLSSILLRVQPKFYVDLEAIGRIPLIGGVGIDLQVPKTPSSSFHPFQSTYRRIIVHDYFLSTKSQKPIPYHDSLPLDRQTTPPHSYPYYSYLPACCLLKGDSGKCPSRILYQSYAICSGILNSASQPVMRCIPMTYDAPTHPLWMGRSGLSYLILSFLLALYM